MCRNCDLPVRRVLRRDNGLAVRLFGRRSRTTATGWDHYGFWQGVRCPGMLCGAEPGRVIGWEEYLAWTDGRLDGGART